MNKRSHFLSTTKYGGAFLQIKKCEYNKINSKHFTDTLLTCYCVDMNTDS